MNSRKTVAALIAVGVAVGVSATAATTAQAADDEIKTSLSGAAEVPGPGDVNGTGKFKAVLGADTLCYTIRAKKIGDPVAAHIHVGGEDVAGPVIITLMLPTKKGVSECLTAVPDEEDTAVTMSVSELAALTANPGDYYVNVHTAEFPAGAIRGQLK